MLNIAILGFGFVGSGVADVFFENERVVSAKIGDTVNIKYILDIKDISGHRLSDRLVRDINIILDDPEVRLVVETLVGLNPAYEFTKAALGRGISVVTSNKAVVAQHGAELLKLAKRHGARYLFEASVGGGIPVIRPLYNCLAANKIDKITGILNATTNFILTKMGSEDISFEGALKIAQELGYAERDPSSDIHGTDTCRKICILSALAFGRHVPPESVSTQGITGVTLEDIKNAAKIGCKIKLVAQAQAQEAGLQVTVAPRLVPASSPLYNIEDIFNGIIVTGNLTGDIMFYGKGAGKLPTASSVVADVIDALTESTKNISWEESGAPVCGQGRSAHYMRVGFNNNLGGAFEAIGRAFAGADIREANNKRELFFVTQAVDGRALGGGAEILAGAGLELKSSIAML